MARWRDGAVFFVPSRLRAIVIVSGRRLNVRSHLRRLSPDPRFQHHPARSRLQPTRPSRSRQGRQADAADERTTAPRGAQEGRRRRYRRPGHADAADGGLGVQLRRARLPGNRVVALPHRHPRAARLHDHARHLGHPDGVGRRMGQRQAGHRARLRHRRHPAGLAEARRRLSRPAGRGRARARRRPQLRHPAEHHRRDRREETDGAREAVGHPPAVARRRRGAGRRQGVVRARRDVQGRRHLALHARRQQVRHVVGRSARAPAWSRSSTRSQERPHTAPARRGAARARSTRSS